MWCCSHWPGDVSTQHVVGPKDHWSATMGARRGALVRIAWSVKGRDMLPYALVASRLMKTWLGSATDKPVASERSCRAPEVLPAPYWYPPHAVMISPLRVSLTVPVASLKGVSKRATTTTTTYYLLLLLLRRRSKTTIRRSNTNGGLSLTLAVHRSTTVFLKRKCPRPGW